MKDMKEKENNNGKSRDMNKKNAYRKNKFA